MYTYIHIHVHVHMHTHTHTHMHAHPTQQAVQSGQGGCVQTLIQHGANTRVQDKQGRTPLHVVATGTGDVKIATSLLEAGADIEAIDKVRTEENEE